MALKKEDFTEEQWTEIQADIDRERGKASATAHTKAQRDAETDIAARVTAAVEEERLNAKKGEQERLEAERAKIDEARKMVASERRSLAATKKLLAGGLNDEAIEPLLPLFVNLDDSTFATTVDSFVKLHQDTVKAEVDSVKKTLLENATPPPRGGTAPVDANAEAAELLKAGNDAGAIDALLNATGSVPTQ